MRKKALGYSGFNDYFLTLNRIVEAVDKKDVASLLKSFGELVSAIEVICKETGADFNDAKSLDETKLNIPDGAFDLLTPKLRGLAFKGLMKELEKHTENMKA